MMMVNFASNLHDLPVLVVPLWQQPCRPDPFRFKVFHLDCVLESDPSMVWPLNLRPRHVLP
eukprot:2013797-Amphidinium_carterae.1